MAGSSDSTFIVDTEDDIRVGEVGSVFVTPIPNSADLGPRLHPKTSSHSNPPKRFHEIVPTAEKREVSDYLERFEQLKALTEEKKEAHRELLIRREEEACTFTPRLIAKQSTVPRRSMQDMYTAAVQQAKHLQEKRESLHEQELAGLGPFQPTIDPASHQMMQHRDPAAVHANLYKPQGKKNWDQRERLSFTPAINRKSELLLREKTIEDILTEDAKKRLEKKNSVPDLETPEKLISPKSEKVLGNKFALDFSTALQKVNPNSGLLTKSQVYELLRHLHFLSAVSSPEAEQLWEYLEGEQKCGVHSTVLLTVLSAVLGFPLAALSQEAVQRIHQSFKRLYETRQAAVNKSSMNRTYKFQVNYSFKPDISKSEYFLLVPHTDRTSLLNPSRRIEEYIEEKRLQVENKQLSKGRKALEQAESRKSLVGEYVKLSKTTVKRPQDRNTALFQLAELERKRKSLFSTDSDRPRSSTEKSIPTKIPTSK